MYIIVVVQSLSHVYFSATLWTAARQASVSFTISQSLLKLTSIESVMPSNHLIFYHSPSSPALNFFPASGSSPMSWLFVSSGQSTGVSTSILPTFVYISMHNICV